eukprot:s3696_g11.t1
MTPGELQKRRPYAATTVVGVPEVDDDAEIANVMSIPGENTIGVIAIEALLLLCFPSRGLQVLTVTMYPRKSWSNCKIARVIPSVSCPLWRTFALFLPFSSFHSWFTPHL